MSSKGIGFIIIAAIIPMTIFGYLIIYPPIPENEVPDQSREDMEAIQPGSQNIPEIQSELPLKDTVVTGKILTSNLLEKKLSEYRYIQKFDSDGNFITKWGSIGIDEGQFIHPHGIAVDNLGNVYVADEAKPSIQKFDGNGVFIKEWGSKGTAIGNLSSKIEHVGIDLDGNVFVVDYGHYKINKFDSNGDFLTSIGSKGKSDGRFLRPWGIAFDQKGNFYVTDRDNHRISFFNPSGEFVSKLSEDESLFPHLHGIAIDHSNNVYVTDEGQSGVLKIDSKGELVNKWGSRGSGPGQFIEPHGITLDSKGNVYVVDSGNTRIQKFSSDGKFIKQWGTQGTKDGQFLFPQDIAIDSKDNIYVSDQGIAHSEKYVVRKFLEAYDSSLLGVKKPILTDPKLTQQVIYSGDGFLSSMEFLDNDDIIVAKTYSGEVKRIKNGLMLNEPLLTMNVAEGNERGLLGIESISDYQGKTLVFVYVTEANEKGDALGNRLYRFELIDDRLKNPKLLLDLPAWPGTEHNGGVIAIDKSQNIFVVVGDLNQKNITEGNTLTQNLIGNPPDGRGGILSVTSEGEIVERGILGDEGILAKYFAYGIRNSFGIGFDPLTGYLWDTENGPDFGDEINLVEPGFNSGWRKVMGFSNKFEKFDLIDFDGKGKYSEPEFEWKITAAPTSIVFLPNSKLGEKYQGDMFVGTVDYGGTVYNFDMSPDRKELSLTNALSDKIADSLEELKNNEFAVKAGIVTDIEVGPDGYLYILTNYGTKSTLVKIFPSNEIP